ncbi:MAG TPA: metallophosphoesterase, partial [Phaeodactylibacter sp.]|nr:metallophosphoesterase [Phaeodactylibacter sp.]
MLRKLLPLILFFTLSSCASYQLQHESAVKNWQERPLPDSVAIDHTVYLIGDAGGNDSRALELLAQKLQSASRNSSVLFLGNSLAPEGMPPKDHPQRSLAERQLLRQLTPLENYPGRTYFIAGNRDWAGYGIDGLQRQKKFIEDFLDEEDVFMPEPGCGTPEEIEVNEHFVIVLLDSQWYLADWDKHYQVNAGCEIKSRAVFEEYLLEAIKGNRNKNILIALHHPPQTNGPHGGQFTLKQHLFPLTDLQPQLYLPLPVIGSFAQFIRGTVGSRQDVMHPKYRELSDMVTDLARQNGQFVIAAGHDHSLQYLEEKGQSIIISGAGSQQTAASTRGGGLFAYGHQGFAQIDYYTDGSAWVSYWAPQEGKPDGRPVFRHQVQQPLPNAVQEPAQEFPPIPDSVLVQISETGFERGALWNFLWGKHYREVYDTEIKVPTLKLDEYKGGVIPVKRGGGFQTNSLRLEGKDGRQYAMRSINKDASRTLGYPFDNSFVTSILQDNFSAAHPFG